MRPTPSLVKLLALCSRAGITLESHGDRIRCLAVEGAITSTIRTDLALHKADLLRWLLPVKRLTSDHGTIELNWNGKPLVGSMIVFDTETTMPKDKNDYEIQRLVLATACDGQRRLVLPPSQIPLFLLAHADRPWVLHNAVFDFWVLLEEFKRQGAIEAQELLWHMAATGLLRDTMLLDQLLSIARIGEPGRYRSLEVVAADYAGITLDKEGNRHYRENYATLLNVPLVEVEDRGWFDYAADDTWATLKVYEAQQQQSQALVDKHKRFKTDWAEQIQRWGYLTEHTQVMASIALDQPYRHGLHVNTSYREQARDHLIGLLKDDILAINNLVAQQPNHREWLGEVNKLYGFTNHKPHCPAKPLGRILEYWVLPQLTNDLGELPPIPRTGKTKQLCTKREYWAPYAPHHPFLALWLRIKENTKLLQFLSSPDEVLHPRYSILVSTGRTACSKPNIQQLPRAAGIREIITPPPGHVFFGSDYDCLEMRVLASICLERYGYSQLAKVFHDRIDPHAYTASLLLSMSYDEFLGLKASDPVRFKTERQKSKAINFGVPGGLGSAALVNYAQVTYSVTLTTAQAEDLRTQLTTTIYPEIGEYLNEDPMLPLAWNLGVDPEHLWQQLNWNMDGPRSPAVPGFYRRILAGYKESASGKPYTTEILEKAWNRLRKVCADSTLRSRLDGVGNSQLAMDLTSLPAITLTGRIRGQCGFTQVRNTPFQGLAADGAKLAVFELVRRGWNVALFVHDEIIVLIPENSDYELLGAALVEIMCTSMKRVVPNVPISASPAVPMKCWSKDAAIVRNEAGKIIPWTMQ